MLKHIQVFTPSYMSILFNNVCPRSHTRISSSLCIHKVPPMYLHLPTHPYAHPCGKLMILSTHTCTHPYWEVVMLTPIHIATLSFIGILPDNNHHHVH